MLRIVFSWSQCFNSKILPGSPPIIKYSTQRFLSTNSAIRRGLRKSHPKTRNAESRFQNDRNRSTTYSEGRRLSSVDRQNVLPQQRRPNHERGLDVEDMTRPRKFDERRTPRSESHGGFGRRDDSSLSSFKKHDSEAGDYRRNTTYSSREPSHRSRLDKWGPSASMKREYAPRDNMRASQRFESRSSPPYEPRPAREGVFREQLQTTGRHEYKASPSLASRREPQELSRDNFQALDGPEPRRSSSFARPVRKPLTRAERRLALYGRGDTAPGGIPRSELDVEENGEILRPASNQLRMAAKRRQFGGFSEPGLADEYDYISDTPSRHMRSGEHSFPSRIQEDSGRIHVDIPLSIPYTTPASEFLYGTSVIFAALTAMRRKMYKLYVYSGENREVGVKQTSIEDLAWDRRVEVIKVDGDGLRMMDKLSAGRAHNGYILEASPLPKLPITGLDPVSDRTRESFGVCLDHQSAEEEAVNGRDNQVKYKPVIARYPFVLLLDGILDPGNLGAILRTAFFLGVDAVAISSGYSAPLTPVALKASAGACEALPLLSVSNPFKFVDDARSKGWKTYAAVAPIDPNAGTRSDVIPPPSSASRPIPKIDRYMNRTTITLGDPIYNHPCILMLGNEGDGLRKTILKKADFKLSIEGRRGGLKSLVDSLNVSVAAGLLCEAFLRPPSKEKEKKGKARITDDMKSDLISSHNSQALHRPPNLPEAEAEELEKPAAAAIASSASSLW